MRKRGTEAALVFGVVKYSKEWKTFETRLPVPF